MKSAPRLRFPLPPANGPTPAAVLVRRELRAIAERMKAKSIGWVMHTRWWIDDDGRPHHDDWTIEANVTMAVGTFVITRVTKPALDEALRSLLGELYAMGLTS